MKTEQFVMAYGAEQDRLRAILPDGFESLRPVLRINAEIRGENVGYAEFNTAVAHGGKRGWLNIAAFENISFFTDGNTVRFENDFLEISFTGTGIEGGCPAEKDNDGCFFLSGGETLRPPEIIMERKEFCDCSFRWKSPSGAEGVSIGKTLPATPTEVERVYPKQDFNVENAAVIPCIQVLGSYRVTFKR